MDEYNFQDILSYLTVGDKALEQLISDISDEIILHAKATFLPKLEQFIIDLNELNTLTKEELAERFDKQELGVRFLFTIYFVNYIIIPQKKYPLSTKLNSILYKEFIVGNIEKLHWL